MFFPKAETNHREKKVYLSWGWRCKCMGTHTHIILFVLYLAHQEWLSQLDERVHTYSFFSFLSLSLLLLVFSPFFFSHHRTTCFFNPISKLFPICSWLPLVAFGSLPAIWVSIFPLTLFLFLCVFLYLSSRFLFPSLHPFSHSPLRQTVRKDGEEDKRGWDVHEGEKLKGKKKIDWKKERERE